jgi:hypothetical protein
MDDRGTVIGPMSGRRGRRRGSIIVCVVVAMSGRRGRRGSITVCIIVSIILGTSFHLDVLGALSHLFPDNKVEVAVDVDVRGEGVGVVVARMIGFAIVVARMTVILIATSRRVRLRFVLIGIATSVAIGIGLIGIEFATSGGVTVPSIAIPEGGTFKCRSQTGAIKGVRHQMMILDSVFVWSRGINSKYLRFCVISR